MRQKLSRLVADQRAALEQRFAEPLTLRQRNRIQVLLRADRGETDEEIAAELAISAGTALNVRRRFAAEGLEAALTEKPRRGVPAKLDGKAEAMVIALACSKAPDGRARWTAKGTILVLLAGTIPFLSFVAERVVTRRTRAGERV